MLVEEALYLDEDDLKAAENVAESTVTWLKQLDRELTEDEQSLALVCIAYCKLFDEHGPRVIH